MNEEEEIRYQARRILVDELWKILDPHMKAEKKDKNLLRVAKHVMEQCEHWEKRSRKEQAMQAETHSKLKYAYEEIGRLTLGHTRS